MSSSRRRVAADLYLINESAEDRMSRVEELRRSVAAGLYEVPASDVADALVAFFSRNPYPEPAPNTGARDDSC